MWASLCGLAGNIKDHGMLSGFFVNFFNLDLQCTIYYILLMHPEINRNLLPNAQNLKCCDFPSGNLLKHSSGLATKYLPTATISR